jgi:hypothetical protein
VRLSGWEALWTVTPNLLAVGAVGQGDFAAAAALIAQADAVREATGSHIAPYAP